VVSGAVIHFAYMAAILLGGAGVLVLDRRLRLGAAGPRLIRAIALTVPPLLVFDGVGAARGWFASSARLNSLIVAPGVPVEEPVLLAFLSLLSVVLWRLFRPPAR
jgi:lycopene cyclase domain-containing protein